MELLSLAVQGRLVEEYVQAADSAAAEEVVVASLAGQGMVGGRAR